MPFGRNQYKDLNYFNFSYMPQQLFVDGSMFSVSLSF